MCEQPYSKSRIIFPTSAQGVQKSGIIPKCEFDSNDDYEYHNEGECILFSSREN